ncbi:MAG TPA: phage holin family protein [Clostridiales bacterium]|nr:phage holin family protein [Clostridiales bacterium]
MEKFNWISVALAAVGTFFNYIFGGWDISLAVLVAFIILDYLTGILTAIVNKSLSSDIGARGIAKKALIFVVLIVAVLLDRLLNNGEWIFRTLVCYFYIANEGISLIENAANLGLPIPKKLRDVLYQVKNDNGQK